MGADCKRASFFGESVKNSLFKFGGCWFYFILSFLTCQTKNYLISEGKLIARPEQIFSLFT